MTLSKAYNAPVRVSTPAALRHLDTVRFDWLSEAIRLGESLECWSRGVPADLLDDVVFHTARFPAYLARISGDDDGDFHGTVFHLVRSASLALDLPPYYLLERDPVPASRARKTARHISQWCLDGGEERLKWMRQQVWFEPSIAMHARKSVRKALRRYAVPALVGHGWKQCQIASTLGCSPATVSRDMARHRRETPGTAPKSTAPRGWTPPEEKRVLELMRMPGLEEDEALEALSAELGRTQIAIRRKYFRLAASGR